MIHVILMCQGQIKSSHICAYFPKGQNTAYSEALGCEDGPPTLGVLYRLMSYKPELFEV